MLKQAKDYNDIRKFKIHGGTIKLKTSKMILINNSRKSEAWNSI